MKYWSRTLRLGKWGLWFESTLFRWVLWFGVYDSTWVCNGKTLPRWRPIWANGMTKPWKYWPRRRSSRFFQYLKDEPSDIKQGSDEWVAWFEKGMAETGWRFSDIIP